MTKAETAKILLKGLVKPSDWSDRTPSLQLKQDLEDYFSVPVYPVNSGRSAIYLILKSVGIGKGDEVLIQAYTCNAVPNPIIWVGAKPVYADIDLETLNVDVNDLESKITSKTKAIILQHTFGRPGPIEALISISKKHNLLLIEDCAHSLGATYKGKDLGTFGDVAILSFGREKVVSSLAGGAILIKNRKLEPAIKKAVDTLTYPPFTSFLKELNNFFTWRILIRKVFFSKSGSSLLNYLNKHDFFNVVTSSKELVGEKPSWYPKLFPGTLAKIASLELERVDEVNRKRREIALFYEKNIKNGDFQLLPRHNGVYLRYAVLHQNAEKVYEQAKKRKFWFGNWYNSPVYPKRVNLGKMGYSLGTCPVAERLASQTINLPNFQGMTQIQAQEVADFINSIK